MRRSGQLVLALLFGCLLAATHASSAPPKAAKPGTWKPQEKPAATGTDATPPGTTPDRNRRTLFVDGRPISGGFVPDTAVIVRVGPRTVDARQFVALYFDSYAEFRPNGDSLGRIEFMNNVVNREVMALVALEANAPLRFEDRAVLREYSQRALSNVLMQRAIVDSVMVTDEERRQVQEQLEYDQRFRQILFADGATAARVHEQLVSGKLTWEAAFAKYNVKKDVAPLGDIGFVPRENLELPVRLSLYAIEPGRFSQPFQDPEGWHVVQVVERRKSTSSAPLKVFPGLVDRQIRDRQVLVRSTRLQDWMRARFGVTYDEANIEYAAALFNSTMKVNQSLSSFTFSGRLPKIAPEDTSRVLARHPGGVLSLGAFLEHYRHIQPLLRPPVNTPMHMKTEVDAVVLEPYRAQVALERGLDKDPMVVAMIEGRREALLVERMYEDSVNSKVWVTPEQRRKYYRDNLHKYVTSPQIRFAMFYCDSKAAADSVMAQIRSGVKAEAILLADSLGGRRRGSIRSQYRHEEQLPYHKAIFEEVPIGKVDAFGPDEENGWMVIHPLEFIEGRQLSYEDSEKWVDESLQNEESEKRLKEFLARHKKRFRIETHPELLMRLYLVDPVTRDAPL